MPLNLDFEIKKINKKLFKKLGFDRQPKSEMEVVEIKIKEKEKTGLSWVIFNQKEKQEEEILRQIKLVKDFLKTEKYFSIQQVLENLKLKINLETPILTTVDIALHDLEAKKQGWKLKDLIAFKYKPEKFKVSFLQTVKYKFEQINNPYFCYQIGLEKYSKKNGKIQESISFSLDGKKNRNKFYQGKQNLNLTEAIKTIKELEQKNYTGIFDILENSNNLADLITLQKNTVLDIYYKLNFKNKENLTKIIDQKLNLGIVLELQEMGGIYETVKSIEKYKNLNSNSLSLDKNSNKIILLNPESDSRRIINPLNYLAFLQLGTIFD